jgi:threonyl-tRNA synthetase
MIKELGRPVLLELFDIRYAYFITKFEFNFVDAFSKAAALSTVQIDVENADTYDISYTDEDGTKKRPYILHESISGAIERIIYALLEQEYMKKDGKPEFPLWLSPTQVRIIPITEKQKEYCFDLLKEIEEANIRVDIDDTNESLGKRIRNAEKEWIPYTIVIGEKEMEEKILAVNIRNEEKKNMKSKELIEEIKEKIKDRSFMILNMNKQISLRPKI